MNRIASTQLGDAVIGDVPMIWIDIDAIKLGTSNLQLGQQVLGGFLADIADGHLGFDSEVREVSIGDGLHLVVGNVYQWAHPQLHLAEDARETPHVLTFQIAAVAPAIHLHRKFVATRTYIFSNVELGRRH